MSASDPDTSFDLSTLVDRDWGVRDNLGAGSLFFDEEVGEEEELVDDTGMGILLEAAAAAAATVGLIGIALDCWEYLGGGWFGNFASLTGLLWIASTPTFKAANNVALFEIDISLPWQVEAGVGIRMGSGRFKFDAIGWVVVWGWRRCMTETRRCADWVSLTIATGPPPVITPTHVAVATVELDDDTVYCCCCVCICFCCSYVDWGCAHLGAIDKAANSEAVFCTDCTGAEGLGIVAWMTEAAAGLPTDIIDGTDKEEEIQAREAVTLGGRVAFSCSCSLNFLARFFNWIEAGTRPTPLLFTREEELELELEVVGREGESDFVSSSIFANFWLLIEEIETEGGAGRVWSDEAITAGAGIDVEGEGEGENGVEPIVEVEVNVGIGVLETFSIDFNIDDDFVDEDAFPSFWLIVAVFVEIIMDSIFLISFDADAFAEISLSVSKSSILPPLTFPVEIIFNRSAPAPIFEDFKGEFMVTTDEVVSAVPIFEFLVGGDADRLLLACLPAALYLWIKGTTEYRKRILWERKREREK